MKRSPVVAELLRQASISPPVGPKWITCLPEGGVEIQCDANARLSSPVGDIFRHRPRAYTGEAQRPWVAGLPPVAPIPPAPPPPRPPMSYRRRYAYALAAVVAWYAFLLFLAAG